MSRKTKEETKIVNGKVIRKDKRENKGLNSFIDKKSINLLKNGIIPQFDISSKFGIKLSKNDYFNIFTNIHYLNECIKADKDYFSLNLSLKSNVLKLGYDPEENPMESITKDLIDSMKYFSNLLDYPTSLKLEDNIYFSVLGSNIYINIHINSGIKNISNLKKLYEAAKKYKMELSKNLKLKNIKIAFKTKYNNQEGIPTLYGSEKFNDERYIFIDNLFLYSKNEEPFSIYKIEEDEDKKSVREFVSKSDGYSAYLLGYVNGMLQNSDEDVYIYSPLKVSEFLVGTDKSFDTFYEIENLFSIVDNKIYLNFDYTYLENQKDYCAGKLLEQITYYENNILKAFELNKKLCSEIKKEVINPCKIFINFLIELNGKK